MSAVDRKEKGKEARASRLQHGGGMCVFSPAPSEKWLGDLVMDGMEHPCLRKL